jgi:hypothetical protein
MPTATNVTFDGQAFTITFDDGSTQTVSEHNVPVVSPEATECDVLLSDGTTKKFVPAA